MRSKAYYAAIDLGSNSFHMLVVRVVAGGVQVVSKIKRKVRLAGGLRDDGSLDDAAKQRALQCLRIFSDRVQDIDPSHIRCVGTATLRKIASDTAFIADAQQTLGHPIEIISGDEEAATIYQGIARTTAFPERMLVIDIGGASTELILGQGFDAQVLNSLDMGCVTWYQQHFTDGKITHATTQAAITSAGEIVEVVAEQYSKREGAMVLGASGTFKALEEIAIARGDTLEFTPNWLTNLLAEAIACGEHDRLHLKGLKANRKNVFVSGLCILIALCEKLSIARLQATSGALREGIIYALLDSSNDAGQTIETDVQLRTLSTVAGTYHLDIGQAERVLEMAENLYQQCADHWVMPRNSYELMRAVAYLHELGLSLAYKKASAHAAYMVKHLDLPGFNAPLRKQIIALLEGCAGIIDDDTSPSLHELPALRHLERILRLAILLCQRRHATTLDHYQLSVENTHLHLQAPAGFFARNPFLSSLLDEEAAQLTEPESLTFSPRV
ncbi:guanosine-5'-triphosphate,3'-diphosphate pyrophosphatase [Aliidiomarina soli]|uniref:Guanosine-5'-triphosphate,3'-diphosphate pyrophosphatase n=1 Tax=Aliidiomarina soli TaxID=1928574 RepID=A0A432WFR6_9GAMM|nr:guanosine-5'-triphosphate,3'-diphosphate pyrophosphatase [Aliidiomarina soli]RUO32549.1 guanosine-5'-triphosphate,3'-diphosphate pyrophosphatase [Aliidiomarina soli]